MYDGNRPEGQSFPEAERARQGRVQPAPSAAHLSRMSQDTPPPPPTPRSKQALQQLYRVLGGTKRNAPLGSHPFFLCSGLDQGLRNPLTAPPAATASISGPPGEPACPSADQYTSGADPGTPAPGWELRWRRGAGDGRPRRGRRAGGRDQNRGEGEEAGGAKEGAQEKDTLERTAEPEKLRRGGSQRVNEGVEFKKRTGS